eukprot:5889887-Pleurochrysis_carterae.AAC.4
MRRPPSSPRLPPVDAQAAPPRTPQFGSAPPVNPFLPGRTAGLLESPKFKAWTALNDQDTVKSIRVHQRRRLHNGDKELLKLFAGDTVQARFSRALADRNAVDVKEFFEAFEFFSRVRGSLKCGPGLQSNGILFDVAGGHGLVGALFAVFEWRRYGSVVIADTHRPPSFDAVLDAVKEAAPWGAARISYVSGEQADMRKAGAELLTDGCAMACVHGCNTLTDEVIDAATDRGAESLAIMPCCYAHVAQDGPPALRRSLGVALAADVHRTYALERHFDVHWRAIPDSITPMNRIITARRRFRSR